MKRRRILVVALAIGGTGAAIASAQAASPRGQHPARKTTQQVVATAPWNGTQQAEVTASCPRGTALLGGGGYVVGGNSATPATGPFPTTAAQFPGGTQHMDGSFPSDAAGNPPQISGPAPTSWTTAGGSGGAFTQPAWLVSYAICTP